MGIVALIYGGFAYALFFGAFLYLIGFLANTVVPKGIDDGSLAPWGVALAVNLGLLLLFGIQHSVMARPGFKRRWTRVVPGSVERSTYVLAASLVLILLYVFWAPMPATVWHIEAPALRWAVWVLFAAGVAIALLSTYMIDHFDLFGLRQVWIRFRERAYSHPRFQVSWFYRLVRHPLYTGMLLAFWATPDMTAGHLVFAAGMTAYVLIAVRWEERDLARLLGSRYEAYRAEVPMLVPRPGRAHPPVSTDESVPSGMC